MALEITPMPCWRFPRPRFSLLTLVLSVLFVGACGGLWYRWEPWVLSLTVPDTYRSAHPELSRFSRGSHYLAVSYQHWMYDSIEDNPAEALTAIFDLETGARVWELPKYVPPGTTQPVNPYFLPREFDPQRMLLMYELPENRYYHVEVWALGAPGPELSCDVQGNSRTPDLSVVVGDRLYMAEYNDLVSWDLRAGKELFRLERASSGEGFLTTSEATICSNISEIESAEDLLEFSARVEHTKRSLDIRPAIKTALAPNGSVLLTAIDYGTVKRVQFWDPLTLRRRAERVLPDKQCFNSNGPLLTEDGRIAQIDLYGCSPLSVSTDTGQDINLPPFLREKYIGFSVDGKRIFWNTDKHYVTDTETSFKLHIWDREARRMIVSDLAMDGNTSATNMRLLLRKVDLPRRSEQGLELTDVEGTFRAALDYRSYAFFLSGDGCEFSLDSQWVAVPGHVFHRRRPEYWWGIAWLPEFWVAYFAGGALLVIAAKHLRRRWAERVALPCSPAMP